MQQIRNDASVIFTAEYLSPFTLVGTVLNLYHHLPIFSIAQSYPTSSLNSDDNHMLQSFKMNDADH